MTLDEIKACNKPTLTPAEVASSIGKVMSGKARRGMTFAATKKPSGAALPNGD